MRNVMIIVKEFWRKTTLNLAAVSLVSLLTLSPIAVHADNYGSGVYGNDVYNSSGTSSDGSSGSSNGSSSSGSTSTPASSSDTSEATVVKTPSGLEVAINLSDGQAIPSTGYYITITPLNGQGKSFDKAEIYLDGVLAYSGAPDSTGTLKWLWDTAKNPATKVKIIVYGPGSDTTTHEFSVTVMPVESATTDNSQTTSTAESTATTSGWPVWLTWTIVGSILLLLILAIWLIVRRRRDQPTPPPSAFTPMQ